MSFTVGQKLRASDASLPATVMASDTSVSDGTTTSTSFTNTLTTTGTRGVAFVAPASGAVLVSGSIDGRRSDAAGFVITDFEIREGGTVGSGTVVRASDENTAATPASDSAGQHTFATIAPTLVTGLTADATYNACLTYRVTAGTGTYSRRKITVQPTS